MENRLTKSFRWAIVCLMAITVMAVADTIVDKSFDVSSGGTLFVESDLGSIEVRTGNGNRVDVKLYAEKRGWFSDRSDKIEDLLEVTVEKDGKDVRVKAWKKHRRNWDNWGNMRVEYVITVPQQYNVDLHTGGGSIDVGDLEGEVRAHTSGGSLNFGDIKGPVFGETSGGSITLDGCVGDADIKTSGGSINIGQVEGNVDAKTSGGSIRIDKASGNVYAKASGGSSKVEEVMGDIDAKTSGGSVEAYLSKQPRGDCRLATSGGSITVYLDKDINIDVEARGDRIVSDFDIDGEEERHYVNGKINGGGPLISLRTSSGKVKIRRM